jgi:hypothetical protein
MSAPIWTVGAALEYENGWQAKVVFVSSHNAHYALVRKELESGAHAYEVAHRERPVPANDVADDTWSNPLESLDGDDYDPGQFHTVDAAMAALANHLLSLEG